MQHNGKQSESTTKSIIKGWQCSTILLVLLVLKNCMIRDNRKPDKNLTGVSDKKSLRL